MQTINDLPDIIRLLQVVMTAIRIYAFVAGYTVFEDGSVAS